jgi:hypothetical protein
MKLIIAGSRTIELTVLQLSSYLGDFTNIPKIKEVVSGGAKGVDTSGEEYAKTRDIQIKRFPYLSELGKSGGPVRNKQMAEYSDALLLIWDGKSKGSANMKATMRKLNKPVYEVIIKE